MKTDTEKAAMAKDRQDAYAQKRAEKLAANPPKQVGEEAVIEAADKVPSSEVVISEEQAAKLAERAQKLMALEAGSVITEKPKPASPPTKLSTAFLARAVHEVIASLELALRNKQLTHWEHTSGAFQSEAIAYLTIDITLPQAEIPQLWKGYEQLAVGVTAAMSAHAVGK